METHHLYKYFPCLAFLFHSDHVWYLRIVNENECFPSYLLLNGNQFGVFGVGMINYFFFGEFGTGE